jgi:hypothetical protein
MPRLLVQAPRAQAVSVWVAADGAYIEYRRSGPDGMWIPQGGAIGRRSYVNFIQLLRDYRFVYEQPPE